MEIKVALALLNSRDLFNTCSWCRATGWLREAGAQMVSRGWLRSPQEEARGLATCCSGCRAEERRGPEEQWRGVGVEEHVQIKMEQRVDLVWGVGSSPPPPAFRLGGMATKSYGDC